ncbi:IS1634 family transposase [Faecalibaculum rodentium]|uniref:IS1634 family transposase n=1 Tax=Faecalibaculum rodentium TaxID=1702221 RepID=UPI0032204E80
MAYYLRKENKKKGTYLQMYESHWDKEKKQPRSKSVMAFGYVHELISDEIPDPVAYYTDFVAEKNKERAAAFTEETRPRAFVAPVEYNLGQFLLYTLLEELNVKEVIDILAAQMRFQFRIYDMIAQLIFSRIIYPCSKSKTVSSVFPHLYNSSPISEDQVYDGLSFIGGSYKKYIELFNHCYEQHYQRDFSNVFFDCTNYYFEIDLPYEDKQKGPSKENRHDPIIGQALLLDADLVPVAMQMYPGNESEKPYIRKVIEEMKSRYKVSGKTVQVADKGLNCARNIYAAVKEANDGYIFSKSIHGRNLSEKEKKWLLLENEQNIWKDYRDKAGNLLYRLKSCVDSFSYQFKEVDPETGRDVVKTFSVKEKRIVSYNPALAKKQKAEIQKMADKAANYATYKAMTREDLGDSAKYVKITNKDKNGKKITPVIGIDKEKVNEDLKYAGYNLMVTSELDMEPLQIYQTYHSLWKIEESFRITKSYLDARPIYVHKKETIYGHFLICYLSLFLLRVLEIKVFKNQINSYDLIDFIRDFRVVNKGDGSYINISRNQTVNEKVKKATGLTNLDALFLTEKEINNLFQNCILLDS